MAFAISKYDSTQLYRDSSLFLIELVKIISNIPHIVQYSIGVMAIQEAARIPRAIKIAYDKPMSEKLKYLEEIKECLSGMEVTVNTCFECKFIALSAKATLYKLLGSMQKQVKGWEDSVRSRLEPS